VFGLPQGTRDQRQLEIDIQTLFTSGGTNPAYSADLGQSFTILENGSTSPLMDSALWSVISRGALVRGQQPFFHFSTGLQDPLTTVLGTISRSYSTYVYSDSPAGPPHRNVDGAEWESGVNKFNGLCNSKRAAFVEPFTATWGPRLRPYAPKFNRWTISAASPVAQLIDNDASGVWPVKIAVIAPLASDPSFTCKGFDAKAHSTEWADRDPWIKNSGQWIIVGFVKGIIVDTDIGAPVPAPVVQYPDPDDTTLTHTGSFSTWGFLGGAIPQCNMARARVSCERHFLPSTDGATSPTPHLVR
jgi:hypothetical protein